MDEKEKDRIINALREYMEYNELTQEDIAIRADVNVSYVNAILKDKAYIGKTKIKDAYFVKIADAIGANTDKVYWPHVNTLQYERIMEELIDAKFRGFERMIIGEPGCGKTYTVNAFVKRYPQFTYRITVSSEHKLRHILNEIGERMGIRYAGDNISAINCIGKKMKTHKASGKRPIIIIDEAENLKLPALRAVKALYDKLDGYCPIVLIGTQQLPRKIDRLREKDEDGIPQLYRRFKAGKREIKDIDKETMFAPFLESIEDEGVRQIVYSLADNYGELNRYVEPALREADNMGEPLTESFFEYLYKI